MKISLKNSYTDLTGKYFPKCQSIGKNINISTNDIFISVLYFQNIES